MAEMSTLAAAATVVRAAKTLTDLTSAAPYVMNRAGSPESHTQALDAFHGALGALQCSQTEDGGRNLILALRLVQTRCEPLQVYLAECLTERAMQFAMLAQEPVERYEKWLIQQHRRTSRAVPGWFNIGKRVSCAKQIRVIEALMIISKYQDDHHVAPDINTLSGMSTLKLFKADLEMAAVKNWAGRITEPAQRTYKETLWAQLDVLRLKYLMIAAAVLLPFLMALSAGVASALPIFMQTLAGHEVAAITFFCTLLPVGGYYCLLLEIDARGGFGSLSFRFLAWVTSIGCTACFAAGWYWHQLPFWNFIPRDGVAHFLAVGPTWEGLFLILGLQFS
ncbi:hypothetical protein [Streptomyces sp. NPDC056491]|uniref:hypothetical protein n=1 Tax=Streptomyces sp. NPDC056491 TaxID=3345837 RepID=UPI0036BD8403